MNILLVDDEVAVIQILKKAVCWEELGINEVFTAYNAQEAKRIVTQESIQIIISDIEMPQENGISFLTWVQEEYPDIVNIILTGFPDFNYAIDAISIGVFKFLLKPIVFKELKAVVEEAVQNIREEQKREEQRRYGEYYEENRGKTEKIFYRDLLSEEILPFADYMDKEIVRRGMQKEDLELDNLVLLPLTGKESKADKGSVFYFALENIAEELFPETVMLEYNGDMIWLVKKGKQKEDIEEMSRVFLGKVSRYLKYELYAYYTKDLRLEEAAQRYRMLKEVSRQYFRKGQRIYYGDQWTGSIMEEALSGNGRSGAGNELIRSLREYLERHYNESINRKDVEELVHMNQDYLNRSFKCATGYTLMEYVQHFRILKAKEYLADMQKSISEIGGLVGYESPPYFSKIFKKCTGITPAEYRSSLSESGRCT